MDLLSKIIHPVFAKDLTPQSIGILGLGGGGLGPFSTLYQFLTGGPEAQKAVVGNELNSVVSIIIGFLTAISAIWFMIRLIIGGISWVSAGGDSKAAQSARETITNAVMGLAIVVAAYAIVSVVGSLMGINILDPAKMLLLKATGQPASTQQIQTPNIPASLHLPIPN
jgi:hypothetical protein